MNVLPHALLNGQISPAIQPGLPLCSKTLQKSKEPSMKTILTTLFAVSVSIAAFTVAAQAEKKCPQGKTYNPETKTCEAKRGSKRGSY